MSHSVFPRPRPARTTLAGRYTRLEPIGVQHAADLYRACAGAGNAARFDWLFETPPKDEAEIRAWIGKVAVLEDPLCFAVIDAASGRCEGRQSLMRITPEHGVIEVGGIYWGPAIARTRVATEALYLHAKVSFEDLGYRRFEWKCNDLNAPSKRAAIRFGFSYEGLFRQHMWVKGANRDTAWFAMTDADWPALRAAYERWLDPSNFDAGGRQKTPLIATP
ncbi:MAG: GNAT family protein [Proteobacteria bacterium]|nr:GNAT family protein [Pseudomonadota bacterium]